LVDPTGTLHSTGKDFPGDRFGVGSARRLLQGAGSALIGDGFSGDKTNPLLRTFLPLCGGNFSVKTGLISFEADFFLRPEKNLNFDLA